MTVTNLYPCWRKQAINDARDRVRIAERVLERLTEVDSTYSTAVKAIRDLHQQSLDLYESSPEQLGSKP